MSRFLRFCAFLSVLFFTTNVFAAGYSCPTYKKYTSCNAGYYMTVNGTYNGTPAVGNACTICPAGSYCTGGTANKVACARGSYTNATGKSACTACSAGTTTSGTGQTSCNATCSNNNSYDNSWATPSWSANTVTNLCKISNCKAGSKYSSTAYTYYTGTCTACGSGTYMASSAHTNTSCTSCTTTSGWTTTTNSTGSTAYTACYQTQTPANCASGTIKRTASSISGTTITYGTASVTSALSSSPGYYVNGTSCKVCANGKFYGGGTATSCTSCPSLTSGYSYVSGTGWTSYSSCKETKAYSSVSGNCYSGALTKTATSATAWGTAVSTLTAKGGYKVSGSGDSTTCSACGYGSYSSNGNDTTCDACPTADSGWTMTTTSNVATGYSACYQYQTPTNCASGSVKKVASSATAWGSTVSVHSALSSKPGYYVSGTSCTVCGNGTFYGGGTATSCTSCPTLTSGYSYVSGTGWDAYGDCKETKAYSSVSSNCYSGALTKTATSATAWGTAVSTLTAKGGYKVSGSGDSTTCSACGYGSYSSNGNDTTCDACPTADSGWTAYSTSNVSTTYSACYEYKSGTNISSYCSAGQLRRAASSASAYSTTVTISTALQAKAGAYVNGQTCTQCSGAVFSAGGAATSCTACPAQTDGWTRASGTGWDSYTDCYQTKAATSVSSYCYSGQLKQIGASATTWATATVSTAFTADKGSYVTGSGANTTCSQCAAGTYQGTDGSTTTSCSACTGRTKYSAKGAAACSDVGTGYFTTGCNSSGNNCTGRTQCSGSTYCVSGVQNNCPSAETNWTLGTGTGWSAVTSCFETRAATNVSSYCSAGQLKKNATSSATWPTSATISTAFQAKAGAYVNGQTCTQCAGGEYSAGGTATSCGTIKANCYGGAGSSTECPNSCTANSSSPAGSDAISDCSCNAGYSGNAATSGGTCTACAKGTYKSASGNTTCSSAGSGYYVDTTAATSRKACSALDSTKTDGTYSSVSPYDANTTCRFKQNAQTVPTYCATKTSNTMSYSGTAWPANTYAVTAKAGSIISGNNSASATCSQCGAGKYSAGGTATSCGTCANWTYSSAGATTCTACLDVESGWTKASGTGWTSYSSCKETKTSTAISSYCSAGVLTKAQSSATAWGSASITTALKAAAGAYVNGQTCSQCSAGTYQATSGSTATSCSTITDGCYGSAGATSACPNNCNALTAPAVTGGTFSSVTPRSANTACRYVAPSKTATGCSSITANTVSYSGTAWGTNFYTTKASKGYRVSATGNTSAPACTACACGTYQGTDGSTATSCTTTTAGYYANGTGNSSQTQADAGYYAAAGACDQTVLNNGCWGAAGASTACPNNCNALTAPAVTGGTFSSVTPRSANTSCRYVAPDKTATGCSSITANTVSYSGSAWGTNFYTTKASKGYRVSATGNTSAPACTACACGTYQGTDGSTATSCTTTSAGYYANGTGNSSQTKADAGYYAAAGACDQTVLNNGCWGSAGASTACPNNCNALTAPAVTGGTFSSVTPRSANTSCRYVAPDKTATGCSSITANTVSYSGSAWGTNFYTTKASKGYRVSATGNTSAPACTACACGTYQGTDGSTATSCTTTSAGYYAKGTGNSSQTQADAGYYAAAGACDQTKIQAGCFGGEGSASACPNSCPAAESGWTLASTTGLKVVTDCAEITTPSTSGSPIATICTAGTLTKKATNATTWGSATASGLTAKAGRYVNGTTCSACAAGTYTSSATTATSCTPAATGYYVSGTEATSQTACPAGTYQGSTGKTSCSDAVAGTYTTGCKDTTNNKACTGTSVCSNGTYSDQKASSCTACTTAKGYTNSGTTASSHAGAASCKVTCGAGQYVASAGAGCVNVGVDTTTNTGYWGAGGTVSQTATLGRNKCDTGLITTGSGTGANEAADCGRKLHAGDNVIYLRSESRTTPALRVKVGDKTFFGALSTTLSGALKVKNGSTEYSVVNDYQ
ncbi:MAG: hypothetical protein E7008_00920 [Alphaproteobacteria bacterium]|nr:hypothetical protein [Alphaproteobacteria bacterium]